MRINLNALVFAIVMAVLMAFTTTSPVRAASRPTLVACGAGTHRVVRYSLEDGHQVRHVSCVRNTIVRHSEVGITRSTVRCGAGTHAVVRHPTVNGQRVREVVCVR